MSGSGKVGKNFYERYAPLFMPKQEPKTKPNEASVEDFLNAVEDERKREDSFIVLDMMRKATKVEPKMWGPAIIGFDTAPITYADGHTEDWPMIGFSPRKANLTLYVIDKSEEQKEQFAKLGKHSTSVSCLYIKKLADVDIKVLKDVINGVVKRSRAKKKKVSA